MNIHLSPVADTELLTLLPLRAQHSSHILTDDPASADLILLLGSFGRDPHFVLDHPLYSAFPNKCAVYTEDDNYLPLLPGVYCSARTDEHNRSGRIVTYSYVSANGRYSNPYVIDPDTKKTLLFSFQGASTSLLRKRIFNLKFPSAKPGLDFLIENTSTYYHWDLNQPGRESRQQHYAQTLAASHFVLCPRGAGTGSIRLFEVMRAGIAPVLISDDYPLPPNVPWDTFLLRIPEKDIARIPQLLEPHLATAAERGRLAREAWLNYFAPEHEFDAIIASAHAALHHGPPSEEIFRRRQSRIIAKAERRRKLYTFARNTTLKTLQILRLKSPYQMNR